MTLGGGDPAKWISWVIEMTWNLYDLINIITINLIKKTKSPNDLGLILVLILPKGVLKITRTNTDTHIEFWTCQKCIH